MMIGVPGETDDDIDELGRFSLELAKVAGRMALGIAPFVAKRKTPLDGAPFESIEVLDDRLARLRAAVKGRVALAPDLAQVGLGRVPAGAGRLRRRARRRQGRARRRPLRRTGKRRWPRSPRRRSSIARTLSRRRSAAIASISIRAPLGRPAA